jgi:hypothetical protein
VVKDGGYYFVNLIISFLPLNNVLWADGALITRNNVIWVDGTLIRLDTYDYVLIYPDN